MKELKYTQVKANGGTQMRDGVNTDTVAEYADAMRHNKSYQPFPPLIVYFDGSEYWLADGFHRLAAAFQAFGSGCTVPADIRAGTRRDAILHAAGANADHGLQRTNADKRRAVEALLRDDEWVKWSDREIARRCNVSNNFVSVFRRSLSSDDSEDRTYTTKHGTTATMNTAGIGKPTPAPATPPRREYESAVPLITPPAIIEPEPRRAATPPSRTLSEAEAEQVIWRVMGRHCDTGKAIMPLKGQMNIDWLAQADWELFRSALADGVRFENGQMLRVINKVKSEIEDKIAYFATNFVSKPAPAPAIVEPEAEKEDSDEYYTPPYIIEAARQVLGKIDLDPASCKVAQRVVLATVYLNKANDSLRPKVPWLGRVWLNPPFSNPAPFTSKLIEEYEAGHTKAAILLVNNGTETKWGQALLRRYPVCFVGAHDDRGSRISFWQKEPDEPRTGNRYAQMIFYMGPDAEKFSEIFSQFGVIKR